MEKGFDYFQKRHLQKGDSSPCNQGDVRDSENNLSPSCRFELRGAPDLLRKSMERFLIGNVV